MSEPPPLTETDVEIIYMNETYATLRKRRAAKTKEELRVCDEEFEKSAKKRSESLNYLVAKALLNDWPKDKK